MPNSEPSGILPRPVLLGLLAVLLVFVPRICQADSGAAKGGVPLQHLPLSFPQGRALADAAQARPSFCTQPRTRPAGFRGTTPLWGSKGPFTNANATTQDYQVSGTLTIYDDCYFVITDFK